MPRVPSKRTVLLYKKGYPLLFNSKAPTTPFYKLTKTQLFSTYLSKLNRPLQTHKPNFCNESPSMDNELRKVPGLIRLKTEPEELANDQSNDEFITDVEKVYRILKKFHSRVPKLELALQESGVVVRSGLTERVLNRCGDAGNLGYRFFVWASKQPGYRYSYDVYKAMIKILGKMRQFGAVWALIEEMRKESPQLLSPEVFVILMRRFASARMVKKAIEVLDEMPKYGCEPDEYVFGCLLDALCKNGSVKEASTLFEEMKFRFNPTIKHFTSLLYGWCKEGKLMEAKVVLRRLVEACDFFKEMIGRGLLSVPQYGTLKDLLNSLLREEKLEMSKGVWSCIVTKGCELNVYAWTIWIHALFSKGHVKEACSYCLDMMDAGVMPQPDTFAKLMRGLRKLYNRQIAAEITEKVRKMAEERQITFKMYKRRGERDLKEKVKGKTDGRKRRARRRRWGSNRRGNHRLEANML
nr:putative pentatricopeptide repeat-containing protein At5g65820 [Ipomoea batatas]